MQVNWTSEYVYGFAPDMASIQASKKQQNPSNWSELGYNEEALWGKVRGSGTRDYHTQIDFKQVSFKCSCPSRKFPCKHGLALGILFVEDLNLFHKSDSPEWVNNWISKRRDKAQKDIAHQASDPLETAEELKKSKKKQEAKEKRRQKRIENVTHGLNALKYRLQDLVCQGLMTIDDPYLFWEDIGARLVDAQATNLAKRVREIPYFCLTPEQLLAEIGEIYLLCMAWINRHQLSNEELEDLKVAIGFPIAQADLQHLKGIDDHWLVIGIEEEQDQQLSILKQWLCAAQTGQIIVTISYIMSYQSHPLLLEFGQIYQAEAVRYLGTNNQRALLKSPEKKAWLKPNINTGISLQELPRVHSQFIAQNPWQKKRLYFLKDVQIMKQKGTWYAVASNSTMFPLRCAELQAWNILALLGSQTGSFFALWNGSYLQFLSFISEQEVIRLL